LTASPAFRLQHGSAGLTQIWICEIEPFCRLVAKKHFPKAVQYGDIKRVNGAYLEPVDIITWGSPCQSFSVAGYRKGLDGESGLFYHAARIVREMREATNGKYPKWGIMENVVYALQRIRYVMPCK